MSGAGVRCVFLCLTAIGMGLFSVPCRAAAIEGVEFADRLSKGNTSLRLHGVGLLRYRVFFKGYVAALYLGEGVTPPQVLSDVPRRLEIEYFWAIQGPEFGKAADRYLALNVSPAELPKLRGRLNKLHPLYRDVKPGDRYSLTYIPGKGMELALNNTPLGVIEGADFASAYFSIWLGERPISESLKAQLLTPRSASAE